jgi:hypothetical protein
MSSKDLFFREVYQAYPAYQAYPVNPAYPSTQRPLQEILLRS